MTEVVEKAKERLAAIEAEAEKLRTFLRMYADLSGVDIGDIVSGAGVPSNEADDESGTASPSEIVEQAKVLMREQSRPLSRSMLVKLLTEKGLKLPGTDKNKNVGTVIWRSKQFDNIAGLGYWPKGVPRWIGQAPLQADMLGSNIE